MPTQRGTCFLTATFRVWYRSACRPSLLFGTRDTWTAVFDTNGNLLVWLYITWSSYNFLRLACSVIHAWGLEVCDAGVSPSSLRPFRKKSYWFCQNSDERTGWREREEKKYSLVQVRAGACRCWTFASFKTTWGTDCYSAFIDCRILSKKKINHSFRQMIDQS